MYFGYYIFRPLPWMIMSHVLLLMDALVLMPTGGGTAWHDERNCGVRKHQKNLAVSTFIHIFAASFPK